MKTRTLVSLLLAGFIAQLTSAPAGAQDIDSMAPVVVKTVPEAGSKEVAPGVVEIKVTFSKEMGDRSWSWATAWEDSQPESIGEPRYESDHRTCVLKVKLEPNKTYGYWINSGKFHNFKDKAVMRLCPICWCSKPKLGDSGT